MPIIDTKMFKTPIMLDANVTDMGNMVVNPMDAAPKIVDMTMDGILKQLL